MFVVVATAVVSFSASDFIAVAGVVVVVAVKVQLVY